MTFLEYVTQSNCSMRASMLIIRHAITETTPYIQLVTRRGIGRHTLVEIETLQRDYTKMFDVAYQQVIQYIRNRKEV